MRLSERGKGFVLGLLAAIAIIAVFQARSIVAAPLERQISVVMGGIKLYVDGVQVSQQDEAGNAIEPLVYNGTTYLPVRVVANALSMPVKWDGETSSIYLGKDYTGKTYLSDLVPYTTDKTGGVIFNNDQQRYVGEGLNDYTMTSGRKTYAKGIGIAGWNFENTMYLMYNLNGKYASLRGRAAFQDGQELDSATVKFYADGTLRGAVTIRKGDLPKDFAVNLGRCLQLKVEVTSPDNLAACFNILEPVLE